jgi:hypothetical protein
VPDGTHDLVTGVVRAFRAPGVTNQKIYRFKHVAEQVQSGELTTGEAEEQIAQLGNALVNLWKWTNENGAALAVLLMVIQIYLAISAGWGADEAADKQLKETLTQTQVEQKILEELQKQTATSKAAAEQPKPKAATIPPSQAQRPSKDAQTRQQRRAREKPWKTKRR